MTSLRVAAFVLSGLATGCGSAGAISVPGNPVGVTCIPTGCQSGAVYDAVLSLGASHPGSVTVAVCRNEVCAKTQLSQQSTSSYSGSILGPLTVSTTLDSASGAFHVHIAVSPELLTDGDRYELTIDGIGSSALRSSIPFARYSRTQRSDPNCSASCISVLFPSAI